MSSDQFLSRCERVLTEVERAVVGKRAVLELVLASLLAGGHVLLEDVPGLAKTLMARSFARALGLDFKRIQFTPDLMPADLTGGAVLDRASGRLEFQPGPVFAHVVLADEINRAPAKTQAALLEAMQEGQVTVDGVAHPLAPPFLVLATQNPVELEGTYPLPEAQLDRFLVRVSIGYPDSVAETEIILRRLERRKEEAAVEAVVSRDDFLRLQQHLEQVHVAPAVTGYAVEVVAATRSSGSLQLGASPRGSLALIKLARARAALQGRDFVIPEDVKSVAVAALSHRLTLRPEIWVQRVSTEDVVSQCLAQVPVPAFEPGC